MPFAWVFRMATPMPSQFCLAGLCHIRHSPSSFAYVKYSGLADCQIQTTLCDIAGNNGEVASFVYRGTPHVGIEAHATAFCPQSPTISAIHLFPVPPILKYPHVGAEVLALGNVLIKLGVNDRQPFQQEAKEEDVENADNAANAYDRFNHYPFA